MLPGRGHLRWALLSVQSFGSHGAPWELPYLDVRSWGSFGHTEGGSAEPGCALIVARVMGRSSRGCLYWRNSLHDYS